MPDQSSAATEHAIIQEITAPLEGLPDDPLAHVSAEFPTALRGYDRLAVDDYVRQTSQLVAELQATRSPEAAVRRALERVGDEITGILQRAHETAEQITAQSRVEAEDRLQQARAEAAQMIEAAQQRVRELDADTDRIWGERERIVTDAEDLAAQLRALAREAAGRFPPDAVGAEETGGPESEIAEEPEPEPTREAEPEAAETEPEPEADVVPEAEAEATAESDAIPEPEPPPEFDSPPTDEAPTVIRPASEAANRRRDR